jgi:hypothetical protein
LDYPNAESFAKNANIQKLGNSLARGKSKSSSSSNRNNKGYKDYKDYSSKDDYYRDSYKDDYRYRSSDYKRLGQKKPVGPIQNEKKTG